MVSQVKIGSTTSLLRVLFLVVALAPFVGTSFAQIGTGSRNGKARASCRARAVPANER